MTEGNLAGPLLDRDRLALAREEDMEISWQRVGNSEVLIVDGLWQDPTYVRRLALSLDFHIRRGNHPGLFALVSVYHRPLVDLMSRLFRERLGLTLDYQTYCRDLTFAVITTRGSELNPFQRQPHHDTLCDVAGVVYLNPPEQCAGGTSFWRHRSTNLEGAPREGSPDTGELRARLGLKTDEELVKWCLAEGLFDLPPSYPISSTSVWEQTAVVEMRWNRLVLYDANLFHTPHYDETWFGASPPSQRLTQNLYLTVAPAD